MPNTHPTYAQIIKIAQRIVSANQDLQFFRDQKWTVWVVDNKEPNAFVLPVSWTLSGIKPCDRLSLEYMSEQLTYENVVYVTTDHRGSSFVTYDKSLHSKGYSIKKCMGWKHPQPSEKIWGCRSTK